MQKTGGSSFTLTLPKKWTTQNGLKSKDTVSVYPQGLNSLLIRVNGSLLPQRAQISLTNLTPDMITRETMALYIAGADEIEFTSNRNLSQPERSHIRQITQKLMGFEMISEASDKIVIHNIFDTAKLPITATIDKMFITAQAMFTDAIQAALALDTKSAADVTDRDHEVDKLYLTINRQFNALLTDKVTESEIGLTRVDLNFYTRVARRIERIADHAVKITQTSQRATPPANLKYHRKAAAELNALLQSVQLMIKNLDKSLAHQILTTDVETLVKYKQQPSAQKSTTDVHLEISLDRVHANITNLAEATLDYVALRQINSLSA